MTQARRLHAIVRGRVQMVGFRYFAIERAQALGLAGWVRNGAGGETVEVVAEGPEERLHQFTEALRAGPPLARVERVDATLSDALDGYDGFEMRW